MGIEEMPHPCPAWCRADHDEIHEQDLRHETFVRTVPAIVRGGGVAETGELHVSGFRAFDEDEAWVAVDGLHLTPESAQRLVHQIRTLLEELGERR
ncbi:DUF6907 domain-containing protein [Nesterenkonia lacusekhoensis]|uniref:SGNH hydrolase-type esterase domain-containing protein n=1 Tax=Nesterenkonia lacusekhoensis TaxID=150832 RepID=A0ABS4T4W3_9MICC|nr:hypothetical protein [Nesterenkonia lacusekhoensis]MBP2319485.1 hypothetical protein [Nesterenkonia lacusekhoensis]